MISNLEFLKQAGARAKDYVICWSHEFKEYDSCFLRRVPGTLLIDFDDSSYGIDTPYYTILQIWRPDKLPNIWPNNDIKKAWQWLTHYQLIASRELEEEKPKKKCGHDWTDWVKLTCGISCRICRECNAQEEGFK